MIFVDSAIWDAAQNQRDENYDLARGILRDVASGSHGATVVTDYIIDEVLTWINEKVDHSTAVEMSERFFEGSDIELVKVDWAVIHRARELFTEGAYLSFTDATTAIVMDAHGIEKIATFDSDFKKLGFETVGVD